MKKKGKGQKGLLIILGVLIFLYILGLPSKVERGTRPNFLRIPKEDIKVEKRKRIREEVFRRLPQLAIIIDDVGGDLRLTEEILEIGKSLSLSILPSLPYSRESAELAQENGFEVMLHLPMEPKEEIGNPLEEETIMTYMSEEEIEDIVWDALEKVPFAKGVNNHMGSKATEDERVMETILKLLAEKGFFFIDSKTTPNSVGSKLARELGVLSGENQLFIDNQNDYLSIEERLHLGMKIAKSKGTCIIIGHARPQTIQAIREVIPEIEREKIRLVFASQIAK